MSNTLIVLRALILPIAYLVGGYLLGRIVGAMIVAGYYVEQAQ